MVKYFYTDGNKKYGPYSKDELRNQKISHRTKIWSYGMDTWIELSNLPELNDVLISIPPEIKTKPLPDRSLDNLEPKLYRKPDSIPRKESKSSSTSKWLIGTVIILLISFFAYAIIQNQSNVNIYNEIAANSYESDENFDMYVEKFYRDLEFYGIYPKKPKTTIIRFSRLDQLDNTTHIHGLSFGGDDDDKIEIYINPSTWKSFNKPMKYFLMYHELAHDILNVDDLEAKSFNEGNLMYPEISSYENKNMDDFIESAHALFEGYSKD